MEAEDNIRTALSERPSGLLYHYTNASGLLGIFREKAVWASSAYHLNDSNEFRYAIQLVREQLINNIRYENGPHNQTYGKVLENLENIQDVVQVFVASFSEERDLLSQWLSYGNRLNGYAIGVRRAHFRSALLNGFSLIRCRYSDIEHSDMISDVIRLLCRMTTEDENHDARIPLVFAGLSAIKHSGFRQEKEWRLVKTILTAFTGASSGMAFREGRGGIVPYIRAELYAQKMFKPDEITIGPNEDIDAAESALEAFLGSQGLFGLFIEESVKITKSNIPYRP